MPTKTQSCGWAVVTLGICVFRNAFLQRHSHVDERQLHWGSSVRFEVTKAVEASMCWDAWWGQRCLQHAPGPPHLRSVSFRELPGSNGFPLGSAAPSSCFWATLLYTPLKEGEGLFIPSVHLVTVMAKNPLWELGWSSVTFNIFESHWHARTF